MKTKRLAWKKIKKYFWNFLPFLDPLFTLGDAFLSVQSRVMQRGLTFFVSKIGVGAAAVDEPFRDRILSVSSGPMKRRSSVLLVDDVQELCCG